MKKRKRITQKGMSYAELLVVVVILAIVLAIAVPAVVTIQRQLNQTELDAKAETIYVAVQNKLSKMKAGGNTDIYQYQDTNADNEVKQLLNIPGDADEDIDKIESGDICYMTSASLVSDDSAASVIVDEALMDAELRSNHWVIEYNPESAIVYAVYYSEQKVDCAAEYSSDFSKYDLYLRYRANRLADGAKVGYYGGGSAGANSAVTNMTPVLTVINAEKLIAEITCVLPSSIPEYPVFKVELQDMNNKTDIRYYAYWDCSAEYQNEINKAAAVDTSIPVIYDADAMQRSGRKFSLSLTLDDLTQNSTRFVNTYGKNKDPINGLQTGPLKITVTAMAPGNYKLTQNLSDSAITNSLFADANSAVGDGLNTAYGNGDYPAVINYGRHLQNLDVSSGTNVIHAVQSSDIRFAAQAGKSGVYDWQETYASGYFHGVVDGVPNFKPIDNPRLVCYDGALNSSKYRIAGLTTNVNGPAGLFATLYNNQNNNQTLNNITMTGANVVSQNGAAGCLAGSSTGSITIANCQVFLTNADLSGKNYRDAWVDGNYAGGLIGEVTGGSITIRNSAASTVIGSVNADNSNRADSAGGLIGRAAAGNVQIVQSYADCYLNGKIAGGLVGASAGDVQLADTYAAGFAKFATEGAGLVCGSAAMTKSYTILHQHELPSSTLPYAATAKGGSAVNVYYNNASSSGTELANTTAIGSMTIDELATALGTAFAADTTRSAAYNLMGQSLSTYVYPVLNGLYHYGDWAATFQVGAFVYYEAYSNGTYGFYGANVDSTLKDDPSIYVTGDGYGVVYQQNDSTLPASVTVTITDGATEVGQETITVSGGSAYPVTDANGIVYQVYPLSKETVNVAHPSAQFYQKATLTPSGGKTEYYYFNPHFAKTVLYLTDAGAAVPDLTKDSTISVRTARHLYMMSLYYDQYAAATKLATFLQERNIDYSQYNWEGYSTRSDAAVMQQPIAGGAIPFTAVYDGGHNWITNVSFATEEGLYVGFIGRNAGTIRNVVLRASYTPGGDSNYYAGRSGDVAHNQTVYIGVLAGQNEATGRIENCAAGGYYLSGSDGTIHAYQNARLYAGGLVGDNTGIIVNSAADTPRMRLSSSYANAYMGGFVGSNNGQISDSYALGHVEVVFSKGGSVDIAGFAGYNIALIEDCYCATALTASGESAETYGFAPAGGIVSNCRYLNNGTYSYIGQMHSFNFENDIPVGEPVILKDLMVAANAANAAQFSYDFNNTATSDSRYPFPAVVRNASNQLVHYGDWLDEEEMGTFGIFYWEHEVDGSNDGYHFTYLGMNGETPVGDTSLCNAHDDGGIIEAYGYGYYELNKGTVALSMTGAAYSGDNYNLTASEELQKQLHLTLPNGELAQYHFYAYTVRTKVEADAAKLADPSDSGNYLYLDGTAPNSNWTVTHTPAGGTGTEYTYTVSPFFANAMSNDAAVTITSLDGSQKNYQESPGSAGNPYEVRSVQQLQYINWNHAAQRTDRLVTADNYQNYTYLHYATRLTMGKVTSQSDITNGTNRYWLQSHDADGTNFTGYTPIAGNYQSTAYNSYVVPLYTWFGGSFDGQSYKIQNLNISSNSFAVGLFGVTAGANIKNIILYSDNDAAIIRETQSAYPDKTGAYALGGLIGVAYDYNVEETSNYIENCAIAGYRVIDRSTNQQGLGEANVGGLVGVANVHLRRCSAVTDILIDTRHTKGTAYYGMYNRVGGITGAAQGTVESCYSGGSVQVSNDTLTHEPTWSSNDHRFQIYIGGIAGSGFTSNYTNFTGLNNSIDGEPYIKDCYTYLQFPAKHTRIIAMFPAVSLSDRVQYGNLATIENCYYLDEIQTYGVTPIYNGGYDKTVGAPVSLTYELMTDMSTENGLLYKLEGSLQTNDGDTRLGYGAGFSNVTTKEGSSNVAIDGKYSYPANRPELEGKNYPFPAVVQQKDLAFSTPTDPVYVHVHYGAWPIDGPYWAKGRDTLDIFQEMQADGDYAGYAVKTFYLNPNGESLGTLEVDDFTADANFAEIAAVGTPTAEGLYPVTVKAKHTGVTEIALASNAKVSFTLEITANIVLSAAPNPVPLANNEKANITLRAQSVIDAEHAAAKTYETDAKTTWTLSTAQDTLVGLKEINAKNIYQVTRHDFGDVVLAAVFRYDYHGEALIDVCYIDVLQPITVTYTDGKGYSYQAAVTEGIHALPDTADILAAGMPIPYGYMLTGWTPNGSVAVYPPGSNYDFSEDITFTAQWQECEYIYLHTDSATQHTLMAESMSSVTNLNALDGYAAIDISSPAGYGTFLGWYTNTDTKAVNADGTVVSGTTLGNGMHLYAKWNELDSITLHTAKNTAYTLQREDIETVKNLAELSGYTAIELTMPSGYDTFLGWYTKTDDVYTKAVDADGTVISGTTLSNGMQLYAGWSKTYTTDAVYEKATSLTNGTKYLIVSSNTAGTAYILQNNNNSIGAQQVTIGADGTITNLSDAVLANCLWEVGNNGQRWSNNRRYIRRNYWALALGRNNSDNRNWNCTVSTQGDEIYQSGYLATYYITYDNGFTLKENEGNIYLYVEKTPAGTVTETIYADQLGT